MSFWETSDGQQIIAETEFEVQGGNETPIPAGTTVKAIITEAAWKSQQNTGAEYVQLKWQVLAPDAWKGRNITHKLWVSDLDPSAKDKDKAKAKTDKAKRMLGAIDANCGGKLIKLGRKPNDTDMGAHITNKPMQIKLQVWAITDSEGKEATGNWVCAVAGANQTASQIDNGAAGTAKQTFNMDDDDSIPF